jgi:hypothetical protein
MMQELVFDRTARPVEYSIYVSDDLPGTKIKQGQTVVYVHETPKAGDIAIVRNTESRKLKLAQYPIEGNFEVIGKVSCLLEIVRLKDRPGLTFDK